MAGSHDLTQALEKRSAIARDLTRWGRRNAREYPWREELPLWQALIAEVMLQRTRAVGAPYDGETRRKRWLRELAEAKGS